MENRVTTDDAAKSERSAASPISNAALLGEIIWLLSYSELHREWPIGSIQQWVFPALLHNQFRVYRRDGKPRGYVSWAWMSKEVEEAYVLNTANLEPADWKSGQRGWLIDYVAPFGDTMHIRYLHGAKAIDKARDWDNNPTVELGR